MGKYYEIAETSEKIYIGSDFPDEYTGSKDTKLLKARLAKAKANATVGIPELVQIAVKVSTLIIKKKSIPRMQNMAGIVMM